ncbi:uncharacterized protein LOC129799623 isoform X2 [Phlebotomus papatasi]|uniref:uncharacterized protein LOC129799623 isoform X2 n=1 Tax=Phlebotomus papatasi TaxID=29031 RepID=UPI002483AF70|nr:uncharacterized protein LOC129799623 isoform X2 [Phlebotomus papatasi]XP_055699660.1 uncharacterized protein LOC129799623 isoform X2 [Phlebotomus papatasi]
MGSIKTSIPSASFTHYILLLVTVALLTVHCQEAGTEFAPHVTATCKAGTMNIRVQFTGPYTGAVHARDYRNTHCMVFGNGSNIATMSLNLLARQGQNDYCGILVSNKTEERSVQVAVRLHRTLELAEDRFFIITCGKTGFARDDNTHVALKFMDSSERRVRETVYGREYTIKAELTQPNTTRDIRVRNCFAFSKRNTTIPLIDDRGCPLDNNIITRFRTNSDGTSATAVLKSMFKFPEGSEVHLQCDVVACRAGSTCPAEASCTGDAAAYTKSGRALGQTDDGVMLAATTVFVLDPADAPLVSPICEEGGVRPAWLLWLTIALGVLFLIMLLMNIFLCTAMSCSCARTEIIEKEPSIIEEYDPYRSWHGSQYGSRYSLHGRDVGHNKGYTSGGSTIHSNRSLPIDSDHYAIVHSRPGSRHSGAPGHRSRGPPSNL